ncbi:malate synthase G [Microlunatus sp. Gsoil 973]|nr:malate synthase G [Microlunatus sp. Gsoil 973]
MKDQRTARVSAGGLSVAQPLYDFVNGELLGEAGLAPDDFWTGLAALIRELTPHNRDLLARRDELQLAVDDWHRAHRGPGKAAEYQKFLEDIGYLVPEPETVAVTTENVDPELSEIAGPQLVVPVLNARYALNAANARWGSLYDALYGSDVIDESDGATRSGGYNPVRGRRVIDFVRDFLDQSFPLAAGSHADACGHRVTSGGLEVRLVDGSTTRLSAADQFRGFLGDREDPSQIVLTHNGLHIILIIDRSAEVGAGDPAGIADVRIEAAVSTIVDFEDSVAAVDTEDKVAAYRNWLGLSRGTLTAPMTKNGREFVRRLSEDLRYTAADGGELVLPGRSLLMVRNVGHLMVSDMVIDNDLGPVPEGILDAVFTSLAALPGLRPDNPCRNSRTGSIYIVKPKMHGPDEVAFADRLFAGVEGLLRLEPNTIKVGVMDEERRTSVNLAACLNAVAKRLVFINTGFLDRTGDEIHTSMYAGPMVRKADMKRQAWITAYEDSNVDVGLAAGLSGRGQIGKGMWAMPDLMADMYAQKIGQPNEGANTAWVPSPTAATVHALHYHRIDVRQRQIELRDRQRTSREQMLIIPLVDPATLSGQDRTTELDRNAQSILGYVVRWIEQGVGCSKVPDIDNVALMEDRATLRISSQLLANWLHHGLITEADVRQSFERMAQVVDRQNAGDPGYLPMGPRFTASIAFNTAVELVLEGARQPNGYTELILHRRRAEYKVAARTSSA